MEIKKRFPEATVNRLLKLQWWTWDVEKITRNLKHLTDNDLSKLERVVV
jgi:virginiamycin A acetyltransferase